MTRKRKFAYLLGATLFMVTLGMYFQTHTFDFLNYDDRDYIHSGAVTNGLSFGSIVWAFGPEPCKQTANFHPVTTLSWMLDVSLFGVDAGPMHLHNALIHAVNSVLFFFFLLLLLGCLDYQGELCEDKKDNTKSEKPLVPFNVSFFTCLAAFIGAAFWAWHPLRAESVAWVSSRKDVLSILFLLPGLMAYLRALKRGGKIWIFVSGACYLLAYFSKPTAVVYPLLAAMLEYIVTRRISWRQNELLVYLMGVLMAVTFVLQEAGGAMGMSLPLMLRIENAIAGLGHYVFATVWPTHLAIFYKYEAPVSFFRFTIGIVFLFGVAWFLLERTLPYIKRYGKARHEQKPSGGYNIEPVMMSAFGLLWFGFALAPVTGLIQVGLASCADRYTYLSGLGMSIILVVSIRWLQTRITQRKAPQCRAFLIAFFTTLVAGLIPLVILASNYIAQWKNTQTVFVHAARVTKGNYLAYCNAGGDFLKDGQYVDALEYFLESAKYMFAELEQKRLVTPYKETIAKNVAIAFSVLEGGAIEKTNNTVQVRNDMVFSTKVQASDPLAVKKIFAQGLYAFWKELDGLAVQYFDEAIKLAPADDYLWRFKGYTLERLGQKEDALAAFKRSYALKQEKDIQKRIKALEHALASGVQP